MSVYIYDGHGSVVGLANESGVVTDTYAYDAFGNLLKSKGSTENCYRYCGEQFDETTGLYYLRARYMDTSTGRFISQDTYQGTINDPVSLHKYLYANANPVTYSDPSGYDPEGTLSGELTVVNCIDVFTSGLIENTGAIHIFKEIAGFFLGNVVVSLFLKFINAITVKQISFATAAGTDIYYSLEDDLKRIKPIHLEKADRIDTDPNRSYSVYFLADNTGQVAYVGRTKNMEERMKSHDETSRGQLHLIAYVDDLTYNECRWVEQGGILGFNTLYDPTLNGSKDDYIGNKINGINPNNKKLHLYSTMGYRILRIVYNEVSNEMYNIMEGGGFA